MLLGVEGGKHYGLVVGARGVEIDGGGGLGAEVAVTEVEVESADVVGAAGAGELHASLDAGDGVVSIHTSSVVFWRENSRHGGGAAKVMRMRRGGVPKWEWVRRFAGRAAEAAIPTQRVVPTPTESRFPSASLGGRLSTLPSWRPGSGPNDKR